MIFQYGSKKGVELMPPHEVLTYQETRVSIFFPEGEVKCALCPLLETYARDQCRRTGEYIFDRRGVGLWCPLKLKEK